MLGRDCASDRRDHVPFIFVNLFTTPAMDSLTFN